MGWLARLLTMLDRDALDDERWRRVEAEARRIVGPLGADRARMAAMLRATEAPTARIGSNPGVGAPLGGPSARPVSDSGAAQKAAQAFGEAVLVLPPEVLAGPGPALPCPVLTEAEMAVLEAELLRKRAGGPAPGLMRPEPFEDVERAAAMGRLREGRPP